MRLKFWKKFDKDKEIKRLRLEIDRFNSEHAHMAILIGLKAEIVSSLKYQNEQLRDAITYERSKNDGQG